MIKAVIITLDEEFEKARTPGAKDIKKRKRRGRMSIPEHRQKSLDKMSREKQKLAYAIFLKLGNKDTFEGFVKQFGPGIFDIKTGRILEY